MRQVVQSYRTGAITLEHVPDPACKPGGVVVRSEFSLISAGTERSVIELGRLSLLGKARARPDLVRRVIDKAKREGLAKTFEEAMGRLDTPVPLGYSCAGRVVAVGAGVDTLVVGDRVACIGQGFASHAELNWIPARMCSVIPPSVDERQAAYGHLGIIAMQGVRLCEPALGTCVAVVGLGLIGQIAVRLLVAAGCKVVAIDIDPQRVERACKHGAVAGARVGTDDITSMVRTLTQDHGVDAVLIAVAATDRSPLDLAVELVRRRGKIVLVGVCALEFDRTPMWEKEAQFVVSTAGGPGALDASYEIGGLDYPYNHVRFTEQRNLQVFLDLIAQQKLDVSDLNSHEFAIDDALAAYQLVLGHGEPYFGVLLRYPTNTPPPSRTVAIAHAHVRELADRPFAVAVVGAGLFANAVLLPGLAKHAHARLDALVATDGVRANHLAKRFGFSRSSTDWRTIVADPKLDAVFVLTRHDAHADMVCEALAHGKHVWVEKPMVMSKAELERVRAAFDDAARQHGTRVVFVGHNRRFAPLTRETIDFFGQRVAPLSLSCRVNAGAIPFQHWVHDPSQGGGRFLAEGSHFVDLLQAIVGHDIEQVFACTTRGADASELRGDVAATLRFADGSVAQLLYAVGGERSAARERLEVFGQGSAVVLEDWRRGWFSRGGRKRTMRSFGTQIGHAEALDAFFHALRHPSEGAGLFAQALSSTRATLDIVQSIAEADLATTPDALPTEC